MEVRTVEEKRTSHLIVFAPLVLFSQLSSSSLSSQMQASRRGTIFLIIAILPCTLSWLKTRSRTVLAFDWNRRDVSATFPFPWTSAYDSSASRRVEDLLFLREGLCTFDTALKSLKLL